MTAMERYFSNWLKIFGIILCGYLLYLTAGIFLPIILAIIISFILNPVVNFFTKVRLWPTKRCLPRGIAILLTFLLAAALIFIMFSFILLPFVNEFNLFIINLPALFIKAQNIADQLGQQASALEIPSNIDSLIEQSLSSAVGVSIDLARRVLNSFFNAASRIIELIVVPVLTYYFLNDGKILKQKFLDLFSFPYRVRLRETIEEMAEVIAKYLYGQLLVSVIIGLIVFCGMYALRIDYPLILGLLAMITEAIPIVGPIIGAIPAILLGYLLSPALAVKVILFFIIVHQLENHIIVPNIMGHTIDLHPVVIIISLLIGGQLYGIIGMLLAVPVTALLRVLIKHIRYHYERQVENYGNKYD